MTEADRAGATTSSSAAAFEQSDGPLPRVLFVSVNPFSSTSNNGKTFASFFEGYPIDSIAQLYFHRELPSSSVCDNYFRVTDEDLIQSNFVPWRVKGAQVLQASTSSSPIPVKAHEALKGSSFVRLVRQMIWTLVRLENDRLLKWLDDFRPEIIIFCGGDAAALYPKVSSLAGRYRSKLALYITDDYVLPPSTSLKAPARISRLWNRRALLRFIDRTDLVLTIGERMTETYHRSFGFDSVPVMNMVDVPNTRPVFRRTSANGDDSLRLLFAGSLHSNRWVILAKIASSVERLVKQGVPVELEFYGPEPTTEMLDAICKHRAISYGGMLGRSELEQAIANSDVLLHVEADDPTSMEATKLSISTKIPEYLASGRCVLAVGPRGLASIDYLASAEAAITVDPGSAADLDEAIRSLATQPALRNEIAQQGYELAVANHSASNIRPMLWRRLKGMVK